MDSGATRIDEPAIRRRFAEMDTDALLALWERDERVPAAESALRHELRARGIGEEDLDRIVELRADAAELQAPSDEIGTAIAARVGFMIAAAVLGFGLGKLFGTRVGVLAATFAGCSFIVYGVRELLKPRRTDAFGVYLLVQDALMLLVVAVFCIVGFRFVILGQT